MKPKVLIVDNSIFMLEKLKALLEENNCEVIASARNAKEAIQQFKKFKPDFVTMDIVMPKIGGLDGVEALKRILKTEPKAKIVMVTAIDQKSKIDECLAAGAADYLIKPLGSDMIKRVVDNLFHG
jgi:two-component system, chemotaxis family, chemotaxis protein CheY